MFLIVLIILYKGGDFSFVSIKLPAKQPQMESTWGFGSILSVANLVWKILISSQSKEKNFHLVEFQLKNAKGNHKSRKK